MSGMKYRFESFGGVLALENPPMLVHVDREFMRGMGHAESPLWDVNEAGPLTAPLEVHFSVTNACSLRCDHCYMDSGDKDPGEMSAADFRKSIDLLAGMGVFHIALGGGEALERPDFFELASYVRERGIVPNLTTNGLMMTRQTAAKCGVFGQVNVSIDGDHLIKEAAQGLSPATGVAAGGVRAVDLLLEAGIKVGLNFVVTRQNFDQLADLFSFAEERGLTDLEFLRLKPAGRGKLDYFERRLTPLQNREFYPLIRRLSGLHQVPAKIDCSFVPMFCWHAPDKEMMERFSVYGCEAGNVLLGVRSDGRFAGCSFLSGEESILDLPRLWTGSEHLSRLRGWVEQAPEPCRSCDYLEICKGGCRAVSALVAGDGFAPDPECPFLDGETIDCPRG
jgi:radical SAM protein with 4Fe4S-binding SPASM domain